MSKIAELNVPVEKRRGQVAIIIALSMVLLIAILGLAIDGGSIYAQRRTAQNSSDSAALAGTRVMLDGYDAMILAYPEDIDGDVNLDHAIDLTITQYANLHGVQRSDLEAYYVNYEKQIVNANQIGSVGYVPWASAGARGISVRNRSETDSYFMKMFNWDKVGAKASSTAFMGIAVDSGNGVVALPVGLFTDTEHLREMVIGNTYTLAEGDIQHGAGNWGWIDFNGQGGSASVAEAWLECGYNPQIVTDADWATWCPNQANVGHADAPTLHYQCADHPDCLTPGDPIYVPYLKWGEGDQGWWLGGSSGSPNSNCQDLAEYIRDGKDYIVPIFDMINGAGGSNSQFHLLALARFTLTSTDVNCHYNPPTPTPCALCPTPTPVSQEHWFIQGIYKGMYVSGGSGRGGDLRHTSGRTVYLDN